MQPKCVAAGVGCALRAGGVQCSRTQQFRGALDPKRATSFSFLAPKSLKIASNTQQRVREG